MPTKTIYFSKARTALKYGLQALELNDQDVILVPDFVCDSIFQPIQQNSLNFSTYELEDDLSPKWSSLDLLITKKIKAIVMIHYFGQHQDVDKFIGFCKKHSIFLIEDNAHGHKGHINNKLLSTFGDIGISSPRKIANTFSGGMLYIDGEIHSPIKSKRISVFSLRFFFNLFFSKSPKTSTFLKNLIFIKDCKNINDFKEEEVGFFMIDFLSEFRIQNFNWTKSALKRRENWHEWAKWAKDNNLEPLSDNAIENSNPWALPVFFQNSIEREKFFLFGVSKKIPFFPLACITK
jgi:hypothetical protein